MPKKTVALTDETKRHLVETVRSMIKGDVTDCRTEAPNGTRFVVMFEDGGFVAYVERTGREAVRIEPEEALRHW